MALLNNDLNSLVLRLYDLAQQATVDEFSQQLLPELRPAIQFDSAAVYSISLFENKALRFNACLSEADARDKLALRFKTVHSEALDRRGRIISRDRLVERAFNLPGRSFHADVEAIGDKKLLAYARQFNTRHAFLHTVRLGQDIGAVSLWRAQAPRAFQLRDMAVGNFLLPHVFKAIQINRKIANLEAQANGTPTWQLVCDEQGNILFIDNEACELLCREWAQWSPPYLPAPFLHELTRQGLYQGRHCRARLQSEGRLRVIRLQAQARQHRLTETELQVARLAASGQTYKDVARVLGTSPATVRNQLHSVYGKLNIEGKAALGHALHAL